MNKLGFACKYIENVSQIKGVKPTDSAKQYNTGNTTVAWLNRQTKQQAENKIKLLAVQNVAAIHKLVDCVGKLPMQLRMLRLGSDILPMYTHSDWKYVYDLDNFTTKVLQPKFEAIGNLARSKNIKMSFHPGQFCVLGSDRPDVVEKSIQEFEYHADMARMMGYGITFQDFKINVHISGRAGTKGVRDVYQELSPVAKNCITIENEEYSYGIDDCLELSDIIPIVFDIHHHWVNTGEYMQANDKRMQDVITSWRGIRPTMHYSQSQELLLQPHYNIDTLPSLDHITTQLNIPKQKLRAHSDFYWNKLLNKLVFNFWNDFDIMLECKSKNIGMFNLFNEFKVLDNNQ